MAVLWREPVPGLCIETFYLSFGGENLREGCQ